MIFATIVAGGSGTRMGTTKLPKQFLPLANQPMILHVIEKFLTIHEITKIVIAVHGDWKQYLQDLIDNSQLPHRDKITLCVGGADRSTSILNSIHHLQSQYSLTEDDILITHDAVRPFVTHRMIQENLQLIKDYPCVDTVIPATDTIITSVNGTTIDSIPQRETMFLGQTPQTFKILEYLHLYQQLTPEQHQQLSDCCKVFTFFDRPVGLVFGDSSNFKITNTFDYQIALSLMEPLKND